MKTFAQIIEEAGARAATLSDAELTSLVKTMPVKTSADAMVQSTYGNELVRRGYRVWTDKRMVSKPRAKKG